MKKIALTAAALAVLAVAPAQAGTKTVRIKGLAYSPATVTIKRGDTVTWHFLDAAEHTVTARGFRSSGEKRRGTHRVRFTRKGRFSYVCAIHPTMRGRVVVR